jgi:hypothetical protein
MLTRLYNRIAQGVAYEIVTPNEAGKLCGLEPIQHEDTLVAKNDAKVTNCVNCAAVIDPNVDHCEYCGTSYALMGVKASPTEQVVNLKQENKLLASKIGIMQQFSDAIRAMGTYVRDY